MDRSYFEYSQIVETFISGQSSDLTRGQSSDLTSGEQVNSQSGKVENPEQYSACEDDRQRRMKLAFINVLREEMIPQG